MKDDLNKNLFKNKLFATTLLAGVAGGLWVNPAIAQEDTDTVPAVTAIDEDDLVVIEEVDEADEARQEKVVVTGSRLARDEFTSASPLQVIDGEVARDLGLIDAADLLAQTTVVQGQQTTTGLSTSAGVLSDNGPGSATASLRGLDAGRTLVLVNGRRLAPAGVRGVPSAPDLNLIPGSLIERVDVLLDGASSVYGSDAVAGVVNYILRDDIEGLQLDAFVTDPEMTRNGGQQKVFSAAFGTSNDRGYINFAAEYSESEGFDGFQFGSFYEPYSGGCQATYAQGASGQIYNACAGSFGAGAGSVSGFGFVGYDGTSNVTGFPAGWFPIGITADILTEDSASGQALLLFPEELKQSLAPDFERTTLYASGEYNLNLYGDMTAYFEASTANRQTKTDTSGQSRFRLPGTYPLNTFGADGTFYFNQRIENVADVSQTRLIGGVKGELPFMNEWGTLKDWGYDTYVSYSRSTGNDFVQGIYDFTRYERTLANTTVDPITGEASCANTTVVGETQQILCRPLDFLDPTILLTGRFADPADNEYFFPNRITDTVVEQTVLSGFISGEVFELPAGAIGAVFGGEYREDEIETRTDAGASSGEFFGFFGDPGSNGRRSLTEAFVEVEVPVLKDLPLAQELTFNAAARFTSESNFGSETTYRIQGQYAPVDWLRARSTFGTSFRAPNLGEQFGGRVQGFANPNDPCRVPGIAVPFVDHDNDPTTPTQRVYDPTLDNRDPVVLMNCLNGGNGIPGVDPTTLGTVGLGTANVTFLGAPTQVASGSNPLLKPETSEALSAGIVFEQPWFDAFEFKASVTYFDITVFDEVDSLTAAVITARCYNTPGLIDAQCANIERDTTPGATGEIIFIEALNQNLGEQQVEGVDYNVEFGFDFNVPKLEGEVNYDLIARATNMMTLTEEEFAATGVITRDDLREFGNPEWRLNLTNIFTYSDYSLLFQSRYISDMIEDNDDLEDPVTSGLSPCVQAGDTPCLSFDDLEEYWVHDLSATWRGDTMVLRAGVSNIFDDEPPLTNNNGLNNLAGIGYDLGGRTVFVNVTKTF